MKLESSGSFFFLYLNDQSSNTLNSSRVKLPNSLDSASIDLLPSSRVSP